MVFVAFNPPNRRASLHHHAPDVDHLHPSSSSSSPSSSRFLWTVCQAQTAPALHDEVGHVQQGQRPGPAVRRQPRARPAHEHGHPRHLEDPQGGQRAQREFYLVTDSGDGLSGYPLPLWIGIADGRTGNSTTTPRAAPSARASRPPSSSSSRSCPSRFPSSSAARR